MNEPTLFQLQCFEALLNEGSFAAAAARLNRTHPTVHAAVTALEAQVGMVLLDRTGYRVSLTAHGAAFRPRAVAFLRQYESLRREAARLAAGQEAELRVVVGDLCPLPETLGSLRRFFETSTGTRLTLLFEAISGPWERLQRGECDLFFHHLDKPTPEIETIELFEVQLVPVAAPGFLQQPTDGSITIDDLRPYVQCVIRDTSREPSDASYYLIEGAPTCTVPDQLRKRELILQGLAWGHMPSHLIADDLTEHRLVSLEGPYLRGGALTHYAARRRKASHGPVAQTLWKQLQDQKIR